METDLFDNFFVILVGVVIYLCIFFEKFRARYSYKALHCGTSYPQVYRRSLVDNFAVDADKTCVAFRELQTVNHDTTRELLQNMGSQIHSKVSESQFVSFLDVVTRNHPDLLFDPQFFSSLGDYAVNGSRFSLESLLKCVTHEGQYKFLLRPENKCFWIVLENIPQLDDEMLKHVVEVMMRIPRMRLSKIRDFINILSRKSFLLTDVQAAFNSCLRDLIEISRLDKLATVTELIRLIDELDSVFRCKRTKVSIYNQIAECFAHSRPTCVHEFFRSMRDYRVIPTDTTFQLVIEIIHSRPSKIRQELKRKKNSHDRELDSLLNAEYAIFQEMIDSRSTILTRLLSHISKLAVFLNSCETLREDSHERTRIQDIAKSILETLEGLEIDYDVSIASALISCLHFKDTPALCNYVSGFAKTSKIFIVVIRHCLREKEISDIFRIVRLLVSRGLALDEILFNIIIDAVAESPFGNFEQGLEILRIMDTMGVTPTVRTFAALVKICARKKNFKAGVKVMRMMDQYKIAPNVVTYNTCLDAAAEDSSASVAEAFAIVKEMEKKRIPLDMQSYNVMMKVCARRGDLTSAWKVFDILKSRDVTPNEIFFTTLIDCIAESPQGTVDCAFRVLKEMERLLGIANAKSLNATIKVCARRGVLKEAKMILEVMTKRHLGIDQLTFNTLIDAAAEDISATVDDALEILDSMKEANIEPDVRTYTGLMKVCSRRKIFSKAKLVFKKMREANIYPNIISFNTFLDACAESPEGTIEDGFKLLDEMNHIYKLKPNVTTYTSLCKVCVKKGRLHVGMEVLEKMIRNGVPPNEYTLSTLSLNKRRSVGWQYYNGPDLIVNGVFRGPFSRKRNCNRKFKSAAPVA